MFLDNILVLVPHQDDECLGLGGTLMQAGKIWLHYYNDIHPNVPIKQYDQEAKNVQKMLRSEVSYSDYRNVNHLAEFPLPAFIAEIEDLINDIEPDTIFIPNPSYNQDHRTVYDAAITAVRIHDINYVVPNVLLYEQPETHTPAYKEFTPHMFVPIDIEEKLTLYGLYESQVRGHRSFEHVRALARVRGMQCGEDFAEAFQVIRMMP